MPCSEPDWGAQLSIDIAVEPLRKKLARVEAMLCGVLTMIEKCALTDMLAEVDYKEMGLSKKDVLNWFEQHKHEDRLRREREADSKTRERKRKMGQLSALANELGVTLPKGLK
jgi:hypothetical protein